MFGSVFDLNVHYAEQYGLIFSTINTTPSYQFKFECLTLYKRYKKDYKEYLKFERKHKRALNKYWTAKENNNKEQIKKWKKKIEFLNKKREKIVYNFFAEVKQNDKCENNEEPSKEENVKK